MIDTPRQDLPSLTPPLTLPSPLSGRGSRKDLRAVKLAQLFAEATKRGIDHEELRNIIAPGVIGHRLSKATAGEIIEVIRKIGGSVGSEDRPSSGEGANYKARYEDLGYRDGMANPKQLRMIEAMWMGVSKMPNHTAKQKALEGFLKRIVGVENLRFVEDWMVRKVVRAISGMRQKSGR